MGKKYFDIASGFIKEREGLIQHVYKCPAGKWTIGYGNNLEANGILAEDMKYLEDKKGLLKKSNGVKAEDVKALVERNCTCGASKRNYPKAKCTCLFYQTEVGAEVAFERELGLFEKRLVTRKYFIDASDSLKAMLLSMAYQCGFRGLEQNIYMVKDGKRLGFVDCLKDKNYTLAACVIREAKVFASSKQRAMATAEVVAKG